MIPFLLPFIFLNRLYGLNILHGGMVQIGYILAGQINILNFHFDGLLRMFSFILVLVLDILILASKSSILPFTLSHFSMRPIDSLEKFQIMSSSTSSSQVLALASASTTTSNLLIFFITTFNYLKNHFNKSSCLFRSL